MLRYYFVFVCYFFCWSREPSLFPYYLGAVQIEYGRGPNRVIKFPCFDSKLQQARNTCERKQAKRRECLPRSVSQHSIYLQITHGKQICNRKQTFWKNRVHWVKQIIKQFKFSLWKIIVLTAHGVNGLAYWKEFDDIFALSCRTLKMSRKIPWSRAWDN